MRKVAFTSDEDALLMKYIATYNPQHRGRLGMKLYERLVENAEQKWAFSSRHSVQSWRERYKNNQPWFDAKILKYQEKHGISANAFDNSSPQSTVQSGVKKTLPVSWGSPSGSTAPIGEIGAKKRRREVDAEDTNLHSGVVKKMRQETVSAQGSQPFDSPPHTRSPFAELRNGEKVGAESSCHEEEEAAPVIGPDDYTGALPGSGESDREVGSQSKYRGVSASARVSRPPTPANNAEVKPSLASRRSASPRLVGASATLGEPSFSHQQHDISEAAVTETSEFVRDSIGAPPQPSQEPTPPHTSAINSPRSPLQRQLSPINGASSQPETGSRQMSSISQKHQRISLSQRKRTIVSREEDDIFSTPPPQAVRASPPPRTRGREAPHLVEGPFRTAYTNSNGQFRSTMLHVRSPSGTDEEAGTDDTDEEWPPPRRGKRRSPIPSEGLNSTTSREREQSIANAQPQRPPSSTFYAPNAVSINKTISAIEPAITHKNSQGSTSQISQIKAVPSQVARAETSIVAETSKGTRRPPHPKTMSSSRGRLPPNFKPRISTHGSIQSKGPAPVTSHNHLLFPAAPAHELPRPAPGSPSKRASLGQIPIPATLDDPSVNDPFKAPLVNREARRWTLAGNSEIPRVDARRGDLVRRASVHHIDLRALHLGKNVGRAISVGRSNTSECSSATTKKWPRRPSRSSTPPNLSDSNKKLVLSLGLEAVYSRMAENHKFHIDVVREVAAEQPSLEDTDRVLCNMRLAASREFARLLRQNEAASSPVGIETGESEDEDEDDDNSGDEEDDSQSVQPSHAPLSLNHSPTSPVPQGRARRLALKIPTASPDPSPTRPTDYSPPTPTRARAFRRLERQGRVEEARLREARHVRRSLGSSSAEASPEADEQRMTTYLLQLREVKDGVPLEMPRITRGPECLGEQDGETREDGGGVGRSISPELEEGHADADTRQFQGSGIAEDDRDLANVVTDPVCDQEVPDYALPSLLGRDLENSRGFIDEDASHVTKAMADTHLPRRFELEDEDADSAEVEEQVDVDGESQTLSDPQAMGVEAESHMDSTGVDDGVIDADARQSPLGNVLTEEIGHYSFPLDKKYAEKARSSLARSALATLSVLDAEWTNSDDELLLDGNLTEHEGLVRRKGLCSVKFRTAHLYSLLLDG